MEDDQEIARLVEEGWEQMKDSGFVGLVGPFLFRRDEEGPSFRFPTRGKHRNRNGALQGGALMTFIDRSLGATARALTGAAHTATVQLSLSFVDAVRIGDVVQVRPVMVRATKQLIFMNGVFLVDERIVATANGVWKQIKGPLSQTTSEVPA
ncbi:PaaI family thioesterase [Bosea sp. (in: a-proteobacteria)]|uniref:PaaI family thioesterase n=1 Tax=Bosea sp. (in: a-proteobacteria) TaxID=1871050 RepID=UPI002615E303|nr:PaaI family thioesterase [Bosea sp. (in: a-proteobacteria)]MCO5089593.1 PaaI family thioesterase [Bosea sp. (in: a-proteobacteria)]